MARSFGLVDTKVREAEYFLDRILLADLDFFGVQCDTVAFTASARSITFSMQASLAGISEFDAWYALKQNDLKKDPLARFFHNFRRISQHIGDNAVAGGSYKNKRAVYYFASIPELECVPTADVATACSEYFKTILETVYECYLKFNPLVNGQWRYTRQHYASIGQTIDDALETLGYPRGWADVPSLDEDAKWRILRRAADGCEIQSQFERWIEKRVPHPDD